MWAINWQARYAGKRVRFADCVLPSVECPAVISLGRAGGQDGLDAVEGVDRASQESEHEHGEGNGGNREGDDRGLPETVHEIIW